MERFACLPLNLALIILSFTGCHSMRVLLIRFFSTRATPAVWWLSSLPEYIITSPVDVVYCPKPVHPHSLTPRIWSLYHHISSRTWLVRNVSNIVLTFHVPMLRCLFASRRLALPLWASGRLSPTLIMLALECPQPPVWQKPFLPRKVTGQGC